MEKRILLPGGARDRQAKWGVCKYERILTPLDGSLLAEQALPYVAAIARACSARVELLQCIAPVPAELSIPDRGLYLDSVALSLVGAAKERLERLARPLQQKGIVVACSAHEGDPAQKILEVAGEAPNTLIAMSTHGRSGLGRWMVGSVTTKVIEASNAPVLVVRPQPYRSPLEETGLSYLVVPLDGSQLAEQVLPHVVMLSKVLKQKVILVRVTPDPLDYFRYVGYVGPDYVDFSKVAEAVDDEARQYLSDTAAQLEERQGDKVEWELLHGNPAVRVLELVREVPQPLIAMTTHGRSGIGRWVLGSVADRVVRHSGAPVLLIRAKQTQEA